MNPNPEDKKRMRDETKPLVHQDLRENSRKASNQVATDLNSSIQKSQSNKKLKSFAKLYLYKALMTFNLLASITSVLNLNLNLYERLSFRDKVDWIVAFWSLIQYMVALSGGIERKVAKLDEALRLMKFYLILIGLSMMSKMTIIVAKERRTWEEEFSFNFEILFDMLFKMVGHVLLSILPTIKILQELGDRVKREGMDIDNSYRQLRCWPYAGLKYFALLFLNWTIFELVNYMYKERPIKRFDNFSCFVLAMSKLLLGVIHCGFLYLLPEGIGKKHLNKIQAAIQLTKLAIVVQFLFYAGKAMELEEQYHRSSDWLQLGSFKKFLLRNLFYAIFLFGAVRVRGVLKPARGDKKLSL